MQKILLDTGIWARSLIGSDGLSAAALQRITQAQTVSISPISIYEIGQKCRLGKWDEMLPYLDKLPELAKSQGAIWAPITPEIFLKASKIEWEHRDPFDRIIAATAVLGSLHVITTDKALSEFLEPSRVTN